jgi:tetratricopeptide (TPR) repeat protein
MVLEWLKNWVNGLFDASQSSLKGVDPPQPSRSAELTAEALKRGENEVLVKSLEMIAAGESREAIYEYWRANLEDLKNENLLTILEQYVQAKLSSLTGESSYWFANNLYNFNIYILKFPLGSIAINKELSIKSCELALTVFTFQDYPEYWANTQICLGNAYQNRIREERADNLETAITCYQEALKVYTFTAFPYYWAMTQGNLGVAYDERIRGERADNLETAIACYQEALKVYTFTAFPQGWAKTQMNLGNAYSDRIRGERTENLETAIACYQEALKVYTFTAFPQDWAKTQMNLGTAYSDRIRGERTENLETAIACYQEALKVYSFTAFPQDWAMTQMNLGLTYSDNRIRGERADNLETAIACYQEAFKVYSFTAFPQGWAMTQMNLGIAYRYRIRGERADNLETAIACYQEALKVYSFTAFPQYWAITQGNLAEALTEGSSLNNNAQDLDEAIKLYRQALSISAPSSYYFINQQYRLGNALARRYETSKNPDDLQQSLAAYQIALNHLSPEHYDHQEYWQAIPATQAILGTRLVRDGNWQEGLKLLINSLNQLKTGDNSLVYANALYQTGYAYELLSDQENARLYYRDALRLYEHLQDLPGIAKSRESLGNVFVSQGHLEKGMSELAQAREIYQQLGKTEAAEKVDNTYQSVQQVLEQVKSEVLA